MTQKYYNYRRNEEEMSEEMIFCALDPEQSKHYGDIQRVFAATDRTDADHAEAIKHVINWLQTEGIETTEAEAEEMINPSNIVTSAGAWDNIEFVNYLYESTDYFRRHDGIITNDGAIFFEIGKNLIETNYLNK